MVRALPGAPGNGTVTVNPFDPAGYSLTGLANQSQHSNDHEWGIGANLAIGTHFTSDPQEQIKFGVMARLRTKTGDQNSSSVTDVPSVALTAAVSGPDIIYYQQHYPNGPQIDANLLRSIYAAQLAAGNVQEDVVGNALYAVHDKENVYAAYGQYEFGSMRKI